MHRSVVKFAPMVMLAIGAAAACSRFGPLYPPRPTPSLGAPVADPEPARVVAHVVVTAAALASALDDALPTAGEGTFALLGGDRHYTWERGAARRRLLAGPRGPRRRGSRRRVALPLETVDFPLDLHVEAEPS